MEYTPSNTSVNNSLPTHLVTQSNSNINMSNTKNSHFMNQYSPSPNQLDQVVSSYQHQYQDNGHVTILSQDARMKAEPFEARNDDLNDLID